MKSKDAGAERKRPGGSPAGTRSGPSCWPHGFRDELRRRQTGAGSLAGDSPVRRDPSDREVCWPNAVDRSALEPTPEVHAIDGNGPGRRRKTCRARGRMRLGHPGSGSTTDLCRGVRRAPRVTRPKGKDGSTTGALLQIADSRRALTIRLEAMAALPAVPQPKDAAVPDSRIAGLSRTAGRTSAAWPPTSFEGNSPRAV